MKKHLSRWFSWIMISAFVFTMNGLSMAKEDTLKNPTVKIEISHWYGDFKFTFIQKQGDLIDTSKTFSLAYGQNPITYTFATPTSHFDASKEISYFVRVKPFFWKESAEYKLSKPYEQLSEQDIMDNGYSPEIRNSILSEILALEEK